jgi:urea transport system substrate-binding protein
LELNFSQPLSRYLLVALAALLLAACQPDGAARQPIRIGVLHSLSGSMAASERPLVDAVRLAVEEINADGGLLGRPVEIVLVDGASDWPRFAAEAERLISRERVSALFACWTSACRKAVKPVVERHQHLMFYPVQYEGLESSSNIIYTGAAPNQQIIPGTRWALEHLGNRVYLLGSDYIFPRAANRIIRDLVEAGGGKVVGERYLPLGGSDMRQTLAEIRRLRPQVVFNTVNGDSNSHLFSALIDAGLSELPIMSFSVAENEVTGSEATRLKAHYAVWGYFQNLDSAENRRFVAAFKTRFGAQRVTSDPMEAAYIGVRLWAQAVTDAGNDAPAEVNHSILRQSRQAPSGIVTVDAASRHLWKMARIGQLQPDGQFRQVWATSQPMRPTPYPFYRSPHEWRGIIKGLETETPR